jgi:hypothetical protein
MGTPIMKIGHKLCFENTNKCKKQLAIKDHARIDEFIKFIIARYFVHFMFNLIITHEIGTAQTKAIQ